MGGTLELSNGTYLSLATITDAEPTDLAASLIFINLTLSFLVSALLVSGSARHFHLGLFAFLTGLDSLIGHGAGLLLLLEPDARHASCRIAALFALLFIILILAVLASLAAFPSPYIPLYLHFIFPPFLALSISLPFAFPEIGSARYINDRYTCGFINVAKAYSAVILLIGFVFPFSALFYFTYKKCFPPHLISGRRTLKTGKPVIFWVTLCSILLIPHIIQINITHFSYNILKTKSDNEIVYTSAYDTFSIWLRYEFNLVTPIVIIIRLKDVRDEYKQFLSVCKTRTHIVKYLKSAKENKSLKAKRFSPVLYVTNEGLMLFLNNSIRLADVASSNEQSTSKAESSTSTTNTEYKKEPKEKRNTGNKKIVRFAHSVKEISWRDSEKWESSKDSSRERL